MAIRGPNRSGGSNDPFDAYRDAMLERGSWHDRPRPKWAVEADRERARQERLRRTVEETEAEKEY